MAASGADCMKTCQDDLYRYDSECYTLVLYQKICTVWYLLGMPGVPVPRRWRGNIVVTFNLGGFERAMADMIPPLATESSKSCQLKSQDELNRLALQ
mgnify:FL=1